MLVSNDKYEVVTVDSGYKVFMKLHIRNITKWDFIEYRCVAKNSLGHSDGSITLYEVAAPTLATTTAITAVSAVEEESTIGTKRQRQRGRHRKRLRESRRHSYTLQEEEDEEDEEKDESNQRVRIIHRERQHQQVQHQGGIDDSYGVVTQNTDERSLWGSPSAAWNMSNTMILTLLVIYY